MNLKKKLNGVSHPAFGLLIRLFLGGIFIYASLDKIQHPAAFAEIIDNYRILPFAFINILAVFLPWLELILGACLILGVARTGSSFLLSFILLVFIIALGSALVRGLNLSCGCFTISTEGQSNLVARLLEDLGFLLLSMYLLLGPGSLWSWRLSRLITLKSFS